MSEQPQRPTTNDDREGWHAYWIAQGMPWRTEPEIDEERQAYLAERRAVKPDIERGIYPFRDENGGIKLARADVEWLLATHEELDLRGADLRNVPLRGLTLSGAALSRAHMDGADLAGSRLVGTDLRKTSLIGADLEEAWLTAADLREAHLEAADLSCAHLEERALLPDEALRFKGPVLTRGTSIPAADLRGAFMDSATNLRDVHFRGSSSGTGVLVADVRWNGVNVAVSDLPGIPELGDEARARRGVSVTRANLTYDELIKAYHGAERAAAGVAQALRASGLKDQGDPFEYRALVLHRQVLRLERRYGAYLGSYLLGITVGYGFYPVRLLALYIMIIVVFGSLYLVLSNPPLSALQALSKSLLVASQQSPGAGTNTALGVVQVYEYLAVAFVTLMLGALLGVRLSR